MPNHIHMMLLVFNHTESIEHEAFCSGAKAGTKQHSAVSRFISTFKRLCNKECGKNIWQRHFYDHVIRCPQDYEEHLRYIERNPARWY